MKLVYIALIVGLRAVEAFPHLVHDGHVKRFVDPVVRQPNFRTSRQNIGSTPIPPVFDAESQYVDVSPGSAHEFRAPTSTDKRGECPGLNAAANHGFIPRSGILNMAQTITGLDQAFGFGADFAVLGGVLGIAYGGDFATGTWSIGGQYPATVPLLSSAPGILNTHLKYEGDTSPTREDAYLFQGNTNVFSLRSFTQLYNLDTEYTHDLLAAHNEYAFQWSKSNNPFYFRGFLNGFFSPATFAVVVALFSNYSAAVPGGTLNRDVLKSFYSVTGEPGSFVQIPGHERIPQNWYKRPVGNDYGLGPLIADLLINNAMYPGVIGFGGNTGTTNSYVGLDLGNLTNGIFNGATLADGNNLACLVLEGTLEAMPGQFSGLFSSLGQVLDWVNGQLGPLADKWECPEVSSFNNELFNAYPAASEYLS